jgi:NitT/TauT family transport system substrate-binding protein
VSQRGFWNSCFVKFAKREGFFREEKLDVEFFDTDGAAATLDAVLSGSVDVGMSNGLLGVIGRYSRGAPLRRRFGRDDRRGGCLLVRSRRQRHQIAKGCPRQEHRLLLPGSSTNLMVLALVKETVANARPIANAGFSSNG